MTIPSKIKDLQVYLQSFKTIDLRGDFMINGLILDRIPVDLNNAKYRLIREMRDIITDEIEKLQALQENQGEIPPGERDFESLVDELDPEPDIQIYKAVIYLLRAEYVRGWKVIDGLNQDPAGEDFKTWLKNKRLTK